MPRGIGSLVKLEILPKFIAGGNDGPKLKELKDLQFLHGELTVEGLCKKDRNATSLGVLPQLKEVEVRRMDAICAVGPEFYGNMVKPFPSLEKLVFVEMYAWEQWSFSTGNDQGNGPFPRLRKLKLRDCPKLLIIERWLNQFPMLVELVIDECPLLEKRGRFGDCDGRMVTGVVSISSSIKCLTMVKIARISELTNFLRGGALSSLATLQVLWIERCDELTCLWEEKDGGAAGINRNRALKHLRIEGCHGLVKIGAFPPNLEDLHLKDCLNLEELPNDMPSSLRVLVVSSPKKLDIYRSEVLGSSLEGTTTMGLEEIAIACCKMLNSLSPHLHRSFTRLTQLHLKDCPALELRVLAVASRHPVSSSYSWLPRDQVSLTADACSLVPARTRDCTGIASFPEEGLPPNQAHLNVWECENLNRPMSKWGLKETTAFRGLTIGGKIGCLVGTNSFPPPPDHEEEDEGRGQGKGGWHVLPPSMISRCKATSLLKLKFLPREGFLASLGLLHIGGCSEDLVGDYFPIIERIPDICL
ncbi:hypothetical protein CRG98_016910 [Punica granatum]|uniref:Disease resistance RPP13-like protein 1 n=1 Tax=Punica granatum TaxID=22663 RepID=A0A2I0K261_PUNGR|nr:hypothetical protein CRG98_016910 [Punica granatum]